MAIIYMERNCAENDAKFCLENGHICETALCRIRCVVCWLVCDFKVIFTNNKTFLLNTSRRAKVCRTLLMHCFVYFF